MNVVQYRPTQRAAWRPSLRGPRTLRMGQMGFYDFGPLTTLLGLGLAGVTAYVGIRTGLDQKGAMKVMGWVVASAGTLSVLFLLGNLLLPVPRPTNGTSSGSVAQVPQQSRQPQGIPTR